VVRAFNRECVCRWNGTEKIVTKIRGKILQRPSTATIYKRGTPQGEDTSINRMLQVLAGISVVVLWSGRQVADELVR
jgi:hypothetical protein